MEPRCQIGPGGPFIRQLPQSYDTLIRDQGIPLSGGQRIALARALLKDPPILILDEAKTMFDPEGELAFIEDCRSVLSQRTVILTTHRPASLALADRVVVLRDGQVISDEPSRRPVDAPVARATGQHA